MREKTIKVEHSCHGHETMEWNGTISEAINIALSEIAEHAGCGSAAYSFTKAIFDTIPK